MTAGSSGSHEQRLLYRFRGRGPGAASQYASHSLLYICNASLAPSLRCASTKFLEEYIEFVIQSEILQLVFEGLVCRHIVDVSLKREVSYACAAFEGLWAQGAALSLVSTNYAVPWKRSYGCTICLGYILVLYTDT